jgi:hypothetical protein
VCRLAGGARLESLPGWKLIRDLIRDGTDPLAGNGLSLPLKFAKCQPRLVTNFEKEMTLQNRPGCEARTRISCHAELDEAARAPFSKERRMKFAKATKFHRKSGQGLGLNPEYDVSAVGAALNLGPLPPVS